MTSLSLPAAVYGQTPSKNGFDVHVRTEDFPDAAKKALWDFKEKVRWQGAGKVDLYSPCFALWPVPDNGCLVARISDAGCDKRGRPHTLRIEAAYLSPTVREKHAPILLKLLHPAAWPEEPFSDTSARLHLAPDSADPVQNAEALPELGTRPVLVKRDPCLSDTPGVFHQILDRDGQETGCLGGGRGKGIAGISAGDTSVRSNPTGPRQGHESPRRGSGGARTGLIGLILLILLLWATWQEFQLRSQRSRIASLQTRNDRLAEQIEQINVRQEEPPAGARDHEMVASLYRWLKEEEDSARRKLEHLQPLLEQFEGPSGAANPPRPGAGAPRMRRESARDAAWHD